MSQLFSKILKKSVDASPLGQLVSAVESFQQKASSDLTSVRQAALTFSGESLDSAQQTVLADGSDALDKELHLTIESLAKDLNLSQGTWTSEQIKAGTAGAIYASSLEGFLRAPVEFNISERAGHSVVNPMGGDFATKRQQISVEAFSEVENRKAVVNTVAYNIEASRQNAFGEAFFPTVVYTNDSIGAQVSIKINEVSDDIKHGLTGAALRTGRRNLIKALIHNDILKNFQTKLVPVFRAGVNEDEFVDAAVVAPAVVDVEGDSILTNYLTTGGEHNLISLSAKDVYLNGGRMDITDAVDPAVELSSLLVQLGDDVLEFSTRALAGNTFVASPQTDYRNSQLMFNSNGLHLNKESKVVGGGALTEAALVAIVTGSLIVQVRLTASGEVNVEKGNIYINGGPLKVELVQDSISGALLAPTDPRVVALAALLANGKVIGYKTEAFATNENRREVGQIINTNYYNQIWTVPLLSPITARAPVNAPTAGDNAQLATLISTTHVRTSNLAVKTLVRLVNDLRVYTSGRIKAKGLAGNEDNAPQSFGIGRLLVEPTLIERTIDVETMINSIMSHQQSADVAAVLVNQIRDVTYLMYRDSEYQAAVDSQAAGVRGDPTVIIGTDTRTARFLMIDGEIRLAGPDFKATVVTSPDEEIQDKIFIAFGYPDQFKGEMNPMHVGNMIWYSEVVLSLPLTRDGRTTRELTVQPRFKHVVNTPVMGYINVSGLGEAITNKIVLATTP